jgi:hypothetical protein
MQLAAQGPVDNEILFLEKTKAKDILDLEFFNYERKVKIFNFIELNPKILFSKFNQ